MINSQLNIPAAREPFSRSHRILVLLLLLLMIPVFFVSRSVFTALAQQNPKNKIIKKMNFSNSFTKEPFEIIEVRINGKPIKLDEAFVDDDWPKDLTIKFKNVSEKTITFINLNLVFPETAAASEPIGVPTAHTLIYGLFRSQQRPDAPGMKALQPGETDEIVLTPTAYGSLKERLSKRRDISSLTTAELHTVAVYFDDGMQWSAGDLFRTDPARPGKVIVVRDNK